MRREETQLLVVQDPYGGRSYSALREDAGDCYESLLPRPASDFGGVLRVEAEASLPMATDSLDRGSASIARGSLVVVSDPPRSVAVMPQPVRHNANPPQPSPHGPSSSPVNPWPIDDARHNLLLLGQELTLLEGHLADESRSCPSCIGKHALAASALAQEGSKLAQGQQYRQLWQATLQVAGQTLREPNLEAVRRLRQMVVGAVMAVLGRHANNRPVSSNVRTNARGQPGLHDPRMVAMLRQIGGVGGLTPQQRRERILEALRQNPAQLAMFRSEIAQRPGGAKVSEPGSTDAKVTDPASRAGSVDAIDAADSWRFRNTALEVGGTEPQLTLKGPAGSFLVDAKWCGWDCPNACKHLGWPGCTDQCNKCKPPAPKSAVTGADCTSQDDATAKALGLCDEELLNLMCVLDILIQRGLMDPTKFDTASKSCAVENDGEGHCTLCCPTILANPYWFKPANAAPGAKITSACECATGGPCPAAKPDCRLDVPSGNFNCADCYAVVATKSGFWCGPNEGCTCKRDPAMVVAPPPPPPQPFSCCTQLVSESDCNGKSVAAANSAQCHLQAGISKSTFACPNFDGIGDTYWNPACND